MTLYEFNSLSNPDQYNTVWELGNHIETVITKEKIYLLYAINEFFVEIHYEPSTNHIVGKQSFKQGEHLEKYLKDIPKEI